MSEQPETVPVILWRVLPEHAHPGRKWDYLEEGEPCRQYGVRAMPWHGINKNAWCLAQYGGGGRWTRVSEPHFVDPGNEIILDGERWIEVPMCHPVEHKSAKPSVPIDDLLAEIRELLKDRKGQQSDATAALSSLRRWALSRPLPPLPTPTVADIAKHVDRLREAFEDTDAPTSSVLRGVVEWIEGRSEADAE